jgi:hypothetical protein
MNKIFISFIFLFFNTAYAQTIIVKGVVLEDDSNTTIPFAYVVNKNTKTGSVTDQNGIFILQAKRTDTLLISYLGKLPQKILLSKYEPVNDKIELKILLVNKPEELKQVTIRSIDFTANQRKQYEKFIYKPKQNDPIHHPISFFYDRFSREAQSREKLRLFYEQDLLNDLARKRLTDEIIVKLTGNPQMNYDKLQQICRLSPSYIVTAIEYDLYLQVRRCYSTYLQTH